MRSSLVALLLLGWVGTAAGESKLVLSYPPVYGPIPAATYDETGRPIGDADLSFVRTDQGRVEMRAETWITGNGARNAIEADFEELPNGGGLRLLRQQSLSHDVDGRPLILVEVDHQAGVARCTPSQAIGGPPESIPLPEPDRVANVPMTLLFLPLVRGEVDRVEFQVFLCKGGARFMDFVALPTRLPARGGRGPVVEVRFGPDLGTVVSWLASVVIPKFTFWFESSGGRYLAHRMPLYNSGPEVFVVRDGVPYETVRP